MSSYARNVSIAAANATLLEDCVGRDDTFDKDVFAKYYKSTISGLLGRGTNDHTEK